MVRDMLLDGARDAGFNPDRLRTAFALVQRWVDDGVLPGAGVTVARGGRLAGEAHLGFADRSRGRVVDANTVWSIASITKPFTATAVLQLVEQGLLSLDEPLSQLVPEFLDAPESPFDRQAVTLRHTLAHCSGLPGFSDDNLALRQAHQPIEAFVRSFLRQPLVFAPGTRHCYSNCGILTAAEAAGRALAGHLGNRVETPLVGQFLDYVEQHLLPALRLAGSALRPPPEWDERIAWVEQTGQEGQDWEGPNSAYYRSLGIPWGGLFSTPRDVLRFVDLFLPAAGGRYRLEDGDDGGGAATGSIQARRIVSTATARLMTTIQYAPLLAPPDLALELADAAAREAFGRLPVLAPVEWGIGWEIKGTKRPHPTGELTSPETFGHLGATGTIAWADPKTDVACVFFTNRTLVSGWTTERPRQALLSNAVLAAAQ